MHSRVCACNPAYATDSCCTHMPRCADCPKGWVTVGNRCFKYDSTARNYADSVSYCISQGAQIASIHSDAENTAVTKLIPNWRAAYIGAESDGRGNWKWNDGSSWWQPGSDKTDGIAGRGETRIGINCPHCNNDRKWHDWSTGDDKLGVICASGYNGNNGDEAFTTSTHALDTDIISMLLTYVHVFVERTQSHTNVCMCGFIFSGVCLLVTNVDYCACHVRQLVARGAQRMRHQVRSRIGFVGHPGLSEVQHVEL